MPQEQLKAEDILTVMAVGIFQQEEAAREGNAPPVTLQNEHLRRGWAQFCYTCFRAGETPPLTIPDLVKWLHRSVLSWPVIGQTPPVKGLDYPLLEDGKASELCIQLAEPYVDSHNPRLEPIHHALPTAQ